MTAPPLPTVEQCEQIFFAALKAGDAEGVEAALMLMAPQDPDRAQVLLDSIRFALTIADAASGGTQK